MVSSESTGGPVDCGVGSIVWVRRRNGSWWPGKILGPEELSLSHVTTPRSGTPVKLLGREDASVDWYNLEKSKRVKAFRCREFDDCIERAEASQGMPPKKREKYARREDAIMHAIELERQLLEKKYGKLGNPNKRQKRSPDAVTSSDIFENGAGSKKDLKSVKVSVAKINITDQHLYHETVKDANQLSGDDDSAVPRMRGLQDFGLLTAPRPRDDLSGIGSRAKRSRYAYSPYDSGDYVLDNQTLSSQVEIPVSKLEDSEHPHDADEDCKTGSTEDTETDCSISDSFESDSDDEMTGLSDESASIELRPKYPRRIDGEENHGSISSSDDIADSSYGDDPETFSREASNRPRGKRNIRSTGKRYPDSTDIEVPRPHMNGIKNPGFRSVYADKNFRNHTTRYGSMSLNSNGHDIADMEGSAWNNQTNGFWDDSLEEYGHHSISGKYAPGGKKLLLDAQLRVDAYNYPKDVPLVSLISKINGHAIIGHPIKVEVLHSTDDRFLPQPLRRLTPLTSVWKTGRRTANPRGRRSFSSLTPNGDGKLNPQFREDGNFPLGSSDFGNFDQEKICSLESNPKKRMLSSFASEEQNQSDSKSGVGDSQADEVLPKDEYMPEVVTSLPVSLVFSRLHEELNR